MKRYEEARAFCDFFKECRYKSEAECLECLTKVRNSGIKGTIVFRQGDITNA